MNADPWNADTYSFSTGLAVLGIVTGRGGGFPDVTGVTIKGVAATKIGGGTATGEFSVSLWQAAVTAGSGSISVTNGSDVNISNTAACGWMLIGLVSNTASSAVSADNYSSPHNDPQALGSLTVGSGGVGIVFIGADSAAPAAFKADEFEDPVFALIRAKRAADVLHCWAIDAQDAAEDRHGRTSEAARQAEERCYAACAAVNNIDWKLATTPPTTLGGIAAVLRLANLIEDEGYEWPMTDTIGPDGWHYQLRATMAQAIEAVIRGEAQS